MASPNWLLSICSQNNISQRSSQESKYTKSNLRTIVLLVTASEMCLLFLFNCKKFYHYPKTRTCKSSFCFHNNQFVSGFVWEKHQIFQNSILPIRHLQIGEVFKIIKYFCLQFLFLNCGRVSITQFDTQLLLTKREGGSTSLIVFQLQIVFPESKLS